MPFLGTCGGFQHAVIEYARNVLGLVDADHAESNPSAALQLVAPLACSLVGANGVIRLSPGSRLHAIYGADEATEGYHCNYGVNSAYQAKLDDGALRVGAVDREGQLRAVELTTLRFFICTLFQPELSALSGRTHPLVVAYLASVTPK